jgi:predicted nucleic acid-binding protein
LLLFLTDVRNEEYTVNSLSDRIVELAVDLTRRHPLRGYDAVHLATASVLNATLLEAELPNLIFVSSDRILCDAARAQGLSVSNPDEN